MKEGNKIRRTFEVKGEDRYLLPYSFGEFDNSRPQRAIIRTREYLKTIWEARYITEDLLPEVRVI